MDKAWPSIFCSCTVPAVLFKFLKLSSTKLSNLSDFFLGASGGNNISFGAVGRTGWPLLLFNTLWWAPSVLNRYCWVHKNRESLSVYSNFNVYSRRENMKLLPQNVRNWAQVASGSCLVSTCALVFAWNTSKTTNFGPILCSSDIGKYPILFHNCK